MQLRSRNLGLTVILAGFVLSGLCWGTAYVRNTIVDNGSVAPAPPVTGVEFLASGLTLRNVASFPEEVSALTSVKTKDVQQNRSLFAGTAKLGGVYRFDPSQKLRVLQTIGIGLGDALSVGGHCNVNALAVRDFDGDGELDLLASTSQIQPRGRPRLYLWTLGYPTALREFSRPKIESSWSHGLGFLPSSDGQSTSAFVTYCGFGEIVEYRFDRQSQDSGFFNEALTWKQVDRLPASGEWLQTCDADNDQVQDLCVATGYADGRAEIRVYNREASGGFVLKHTIKENSRFGNVHFIGGDTTGKGVNDLIAWWCTESDGGDCEMIRYRLSPQGVVERTTLLSSDADEIMPRDGQMTFFDFDRDGRQELWFASGSGSLWNYDPSRSEPVVQILKLANGIGPITGLDHPTTDWGSGIYMGSKNDVIQISPVR